MDLFKPNNTIFAVAKFYIMNYKLPLAAIEQMNLWGKQAIPFLFIIDFEAQKPLLYPLDAVPAHIRFALPTMPQKNKPKVWTKPLDFQAQPLPFSIYKKAYKSVQNHLQKGNTYLLNLTMPTPISFSIDLEAIFEHSQAPYRLWIAEKMVCFSPEIFVRIKKGIISSYPMKGTIRANLPKAESQLLNNPKEIAEHNTIVDLIRNDLSQVAKEVKVQRYRYIDELNTNKGKLLQMSSEINGRLPTNYSEQIGSIMNKLLPAGSISGAPKEATLKAIREAEVDARGYYTGIFGVFDGKDLDSAVMIRYIEQQNGQYVYRSGGGITAMSQCEQEYQELIDKVYVPIRKHTH